MAVLVNPDAGKTEEQVWPTLNDAPITTTVKTAVPTPEQKWQATPVTSQVVVIPPDSLSGIKSKILGWNKKTHAGSKARLSADEINTLTTWAETRPSTTGKSFIFKVVRGEGSGDYEAKDQLKIIAIFSDPIGVKQPTYHVTLV